LKEKNIEKVNKREENTERVNEKRKRETHREKNEVKERD
jgi:hypothetical protein